MPSTGWSWSGADGAIKVSAAACADRDDMDLSAIALQGVEQGQVQLQNAALRLAQGAGASSPDGAGVDVVDLSAEMVALESAQTQFSANLSTLKTGDQLQQTALDLMA